MESNAIFLDFDHGITLIDAKYKRPGLAAFYLLVERGRAALIDTGTSHSVPDVLSVLRAKGLAPDAVDYVIPTHVHLDHAGGAGEMMRQFGNAKLVIHPRGARHMIDPAKLLAGATGVYGAAEVERHYGTVWPIPAERVVEAPDEFSVALAGRKLRFLDTPGHARHHLCVYDERIGTFFTGDTFGISYREFDTARGAFIFPTTTPVQFDPPALHASIDRLLRFKPRQLFLTHFGRVTEIERLARDMHELIDMYIDSALAVKGTGKERLRALIQDQRKLLTARARAHGCRLSDSEIEAVLYDDYELNAQGLAVWLDGRAA
jgi:glyoxylase-like metal-dependent hydrolase (beta-lactamase superfamily II)